MENTKVTNTINEINQFIKSKMNILLQDLIIETNEYEETKRHILELPFVKKIIQEKICENIAATHIITQECLESVSDVSNDTSLSEVNIVLTIHEESVEEIELDSESDEEELENDDTQEEEQIVEEEEKENDDVADEDVEEEELQDDNEDEEEVKEVQQEDEDEEELEDATDEVVEEEEQVVEEDKQDDQVVEDEEEEESTNEDKEPSLEDDVEEEEEEEVFEIEIDDVIYFTTNEKSGIIYASDENGDPGDEVGVFKNGEPVFL